MATFLSQFLLLLLLSIFSSAFAATNLPCPNFNCDPGSFVNGKFIDPSDPSDESSAWLKEFYFTAGQGYNYPFINDDDFLFPQLDCYLVCKNYNNEVTSNDSLAHYWMFEATSGATNGLRLRNTPITITSRLQTSRPAKFVMLIRREILISQEQTALITISPVFRTRISLSYLMRTCK